MRRIPFVMLLCLASALVPAGALARGEMSYTMPEVRETAPPSDEVVRTALWSHPVSNWSSNVLAIGPMVLSFASPERMCGFDSATGAKLWCDSKGGSPAYAGGVVAYIASDGSVRGLDIKTGTLLWKHALVEPRGWRWMILASTGDDFLVSGHPSTTDPGSMHYLEITPTGRVLWSGESQHPGYSVTPTVLQPYAFQIITGSGATMMSDLQILKLGSDGGVATSFKNVGDVLDVEMPTVILSGGWRAQEVEDFFLTFEVEKADASDGAVIETYDFAPDYDANYDRYTHASSAHNPLYAARIRVDGDFVYGYVYGNLYRYRLADGAGQRPLLVASDSIFLGGPYRGAVYVSRGDGVWALRFESTRIRARLVAPSSSQVSGLYINGRTAYIAFEDGELRGVNVDDGRTVLDARIGYAARVGVSRDRAFVVCQTDAGWQVFAFQRPDRP